MSRPPPPPAPQDLVYRLATPLDRQPVLDLLVAYNGLDYLSSMYDVLLQDTTCVCGVVEHKSKVIAYMALKLFGDGNHGAYEAGRIHPMYERTGIVSLLAKYLLIKGADRDQRLNKEIWFSTPTRIYDMAVKRGHLHRTCYMNHNVFVTSKDRMNHVKTRVDAMVNNAKVMTQRVCNIADISDAQLTSLLGETYFVSGSNYRVTCVTRHDVTRVASTCNTYVSRGKPGNNHTENEQGNKNQTGTDDTDHVTGISFGDISMVTSGVAYVCYVYARSDDVMVAHLLRHLQHAREVITPGDVQTSIVILIPAQLDPRTVHDVMRSCDVGRWVPSDLPREDLAVFERDVAWGAVRKAVQSKI